MKTKKPINRSLQKVGFPKRSINIIGAGRLGLHLALALKEHAILNAITVRQANKIDAVKNLTGAKQVLIFPVIIPPADITFITTPDDSLKKVASTLATLMPPTDGAIIVHCSGLHSSKILNPLKKLGYETGSIHPFRSFSHFDADKKHLLLKDCPCFIEGDPLMHTTVSELFKKCGAYVYPLNPKYKPYNHLAAVIASNHLVTLLVSAQECLKHNGLSAEENIKVLISLMYSTLQNVENNKSPTNSLTGPIVRADQKTLKQHFSIIKDPILKKLYRTLSLVALDIAKLDEKTKEKLRNLLQN